MVTVFLLSVISLLLLLRFCRRGSFQKQQNQGKLPGPPALPFLGNLKDLKQPRLHVHLTELAKRFGPIYRLRAWREEIVVLNNTELIKEALLKRSSEFAGRPETFTGNTISFGGKDLSLGDYTSVWKLEKKLAHSAIQRGRISHLEPVVEREARKLCKAFQSYMGSPVDTSRDFSISTCNVISSLIFGTEYERDDPDLRVIHDCLVEVVRLWKSPSITLLDMFPILQYFPNYTWKAFLKEVKTRDSFVRQQIERHKETFQQGKVRDITDALMKHFWEQEEGAAEFGELTEEHIHMVIVDLFVGGTETTSSTLSWAIAFLIHRPEIQDRIYKEICEMVGEDCYPAYSDRRKLPVLSATIAELLRLRPVVPISVMHRTTCDTSVAGYSIPKGTNVIPNLFGAHHDESKWTDPTRFRPERFLEAADPERAMQSVLSFSLGARTCLGEPFARVELFIFLGYLLKEFQFLPGVEGVPIDLDGQLGTVLQVKPYLVSIVRRPAPHHT
ncbi:steroid 21-hydroxylase [Chiloscyllium plagiosum]|uniref:steroid 21-hydroxylase n=1 Tax=Chiloscyllium plagiosum TaxID=36176 RepID=UPI001CB84F44|nr:steroid 21-hydroxylase [Chiloscyllium plagiosum]